MCRKRGGNGGWAEGRRVDGEISKLSKIRFI